MTRPTNTSALENAVKALDAELEFQSSVVEASDTLAKIESKSNVVEASDTLAKIESQSNVVSWRSWMQHVNSDSGKWSKRKGKREELDAADIDRFMIEVEKEQDEEQTTSASARRSLETREGDAMTRSTEILFACSMCGFRGSRSDVELHEMLKH